ncbi:zf-HC2 domain-containing protein [Gemmatimonas phototrophica]|uniref:Putative zinc-finger domain-containing protein n=1 Tax=Gemmatimonas phototrophica TaxID=1379270 RepID=A0A143BHW2_9BACT|nr:zf-HC2 domain-containing protein [Gemmatimonas phototrophica]AMW04181.1 hypothetical protein GEMMAAP_03690 [Gemmatimonas phototrophica]
MTTPMHSEVARAAEEHLDAHLVAAFVDGSLSAPAKQVAAQHLALCSECRREVVEVRRLLPAPPTVRVRYLAPLAAAAAVIVMMRWGGGSTPPSITPDTTRGALPSAGAGPSPEIETALAVVTSDSLVSNTTDLILVWRSAAPGATYDLVVQNDVGSVLHATATSDTVLTLPRAVLRAAPRAWWSVTAQQLDGRSRSTGAYLLVPR